MLVSLTVSFSLSSCEGEVANHERALHLVTVPGATSPANELLYFDAAVDPEGRLHVSWRSRLGQTHHTQSADAGRTWSEPIELGGAGVPHVVATGKGTMVLVLGYGALIHASNDGGGSWRAPSSLLAGHFMLASSVVSKEDTVSLAFASVQGPVRDNLVGRAWAPPRPLPGPEGPVRLFVISSTDGGEAWGDLVEVAPVLEGWPYGVRLELSVGADPGELHLAWSEKMDLGDRLRYARSSDGGRTWSAPTEVRVSGEDGLSPDLPQGPPHHAPYTAPRVIEGSRGPLLFYGGPNGLMTASQPQAEGAHWTLLGRSGQEWPRAYDVTAIEGGGLVAAWTDHRRRRRSWYSGTPLALLFADDGIWANNDVFVARLPPTVGGGQSDTSQAKSGFDPDTGVPITPLLSHVGGPVRLVASSDAVYALWVARRDLGRRPTGPHQVYLSPIPNLSAR